MRDVATDRVVTVLHGPSTVTHSLISLHDVLKRSQEIFLESEVCQLPFLEKLH